MLTLNITAVIEGGVGKTKVTRDLCEAYRAKGVTFVGYDTDPPKLSRCAALGVMPVKWYDDDKHELLTEVLHKTLAEIISAGCDTIVDVGSSGFRVLIDYFGTAGVIEALEANGVGVTFHSVLVGPPKLDTTLSSCAGLMAAFPRCKHIVWLNPCPAYGGLDDLPELPAWEYLSERAAAIIEMPKPPKFVVKEYAEMLAGEDTYDKYLEKNPVVAAMLAPAWKNLREQIVKAVGIG